MTRSIFRRLLVIAATLVAVAVPLGLLVGLEDHRGFFAPVWTGDGRHVYVLERRTRGIVWGLGWEFFTPPASSYVLSDEFRLLEVDSETGALTTLARISGSPVTGRTTRHYRSRIFNTVSARIDPDAEGCTFLVKMSVPRVPTSEQWSLRGNCSADAAAPEWREESGGSTSKSDAVLADGLELVTVPGTEAFPAAVLAVPAEGEYRVLLESTDFRKLYPDGVSASVIETQSVRESIERSRDIERVRAALEADHRQQGLSEYEAALKVHDDMERLGYDPMRPRIVATLLAEDRCDAAAFEIPPDRFDVGLFQDVAAAVAQPGTRVLTSTGSYLKYYDDETGPRLRAWREAGNDRFCVRVNEALYRLEVQREG